MEYDLDQESTQLWNGYGIRDPSTHNECSHGMKQCQETEATMQQAKILM